jgi:hypothetical protein
MNMGIDFSSLMPMSCLPPGCFCPPEELPPEGMEDWSGDYVKGDLSSKPPSELARMIDSWSGSAEDLILMVMIAVSKDMDEKIRVKAKEVFQLRQKSQAKEKEGDESTEALDQATQELQQMTKQRDQFFQMFQKILDALVSSTDKLLANWK